MTPYSGSLTCVARSKAPLLGSEASLMVLRAEKHVVLDVHEDLLEDPCGWQASDSGPKLVESRVKVDDDLELT